VRPKVGGPDMVVQPMTTPYRINLTATGMADHLPCQLYDGTKFNTQVFHPTTLYLVTAYAAPATPVIFAPGDLVRHAAGGPQLVVQPITPAHKFSYAAVGMSDFLPCQWYNGKEHKSDAFHRLPLFKC
jgi:uncharacterized protein YodC (DUF2158 family)